MGTGHIMRCLTLADELRARGANCQFICRNQPGHLIQTIQKRGYPVSMLTAFEPPDESSDWYRKVSHAGWLGTAWQADAVETRKVLETSHIDWLILDHYALGNDWESYVRPACRYIMVIDDLADRPHVCDILLDQNWFGAKTGARYKRLVSADCQQLLGPSFALLRPEYASLRKLSPVRNGVVRRLLVFLGGSDPDNQTSKVLRALSMNEELSRLAVDVVIGVNHPDPQSLELFSNKIAGLSIYKNLPTLAGLMFRADLIVGAGGSTTWERMALGVPSVVIGIADNQMETNHELMKDGLVTFLGAMQDVSSQHMAAVLLDCIRQPELLARQNHATWNMVDGQGAMRVADMLCGVTR